MDTLAMIRSEFAAYIKKHPLSDETILHLRTIQSIIETELLLDDQHEYNKEKEYFEDYLLDQNE